MVNSPLEPGRRPRRAMQITQSVPTVGPLTQAEFEQRFVRVGRPVVIRGMLERWPARASWAAERLRTRLGDVVLRGKVSTNHMHPNFLAPSMAQMFRTEERSVAAWLERMLARDSQRARYLISGQEEPLVNVRRGQARQTSAKLAALVDDFALPPLFDESRLYTIWTWFSGAGVRTWLHFDNNGCDNLNAQVHGEKRCWLVPPGQQWRLSPFPLGAAVPAYNCSQVNLESPDLAQFPEFAQCQGWEGRLEAGDLLYIPAFWYHAFEHLGRYNANVNFWWRPTETRPSDVAHRWQLHRQCAQALADESESDAHALDGGRFAAQSAAVRAFLSRLDKLALSRPAE
ncbi:MAG: cupin-like domain-containing protein [Myxococcales bacterium FL481]|nr:MAG: cupin-like domain-containing protein [Myxococcales bacterium FL481]